MNKLRFKFTIKRKVKIKPKIKLSRVLLSYVAGFIDGDGSIMAQIVAKEDTVLKYQIRVSLTITQKKSRIWFLKKIKQQLCLGNVRDRKDGIGEFSISARKDIILLLNTITPFLRIKKKQAILAKKICERLELQKNLNVDPFQFMKLCTLADKLASLNDSKTRKNRTKNVRKTLIALQFINKERRLKLIFAKNIYKKSKVKHIFYRKTNRKRKVKAIFLQKQKQGPVETS